MLFHSGRSDTCWAGMKSWLKDRVQEPSSLCHLAGTDAAGASHAILRVETQRSRLNWCMNSWRKSSRFQILRAALAKKPASLSFWPYDVCQLGIARRGLIVAVPSLGHHCAAADVGDGGKGSRLALGMHWPQDLIVATLISGCW